MLALKYMEEIGSREGSQDSHDFHKSYGGYQNFHFVIECVSNSYVSLII